MDSGLILAPSLEAAFSNYRMSLIVSEFEDRDYVTLLAEALMSVMSSEGMIRSARIFLEVLDLLTDSIIEAISLLNATSWERAWSLCSMIPFFLLSC